MPEYPKTATKTQCRYCGQLVNTNDLSIHIQDKHPRPRQQTRPRLVKKKDDK